MQALIQLDGIQTNANTLTGHFITPDNLNHHPLQPRRAEKHVRTWDTVGFDVDGLQQWKTKLRPTAASQE